MNAPVRRQELGPIDIEVEQAVLGAILLNNAALESIGFLGPEHFGEPVHKFIFENILAQVKAGRATPATLRPYFPEGQKVGSMAPNEYLAHLCSVAVPVISAAECARSVFDCAMRRRLVTVGNAIAATAMTYQHDHPIADQIANAEAELFELSSLQERMLPDKHVDILAQIEERVAAGGRLSGVSCGIAEIDKKIGGFAPGALIIIAGRPGMGKTMVGLSLARRAAHCGVGVAFDSIEMPREQVVVRLMADETEAMQQPVPYFAISKGDLNPSQHNSVKRAYERVKDLPLFINDKGNRLADIPAHIRSARRALEKQGKTLGLYIVDYLGLLRPSDRYSGNKVHEVGEISATLKELAKRERLPIIALHQLNRALERAEDKRPTLADLRDSGNIEQDADVVGFVYREHYYLDRPGARVPGGDPGDGRTEEGRRLERLANVRNDMELIFAKNRQGPTGTARLWCNMATNSLRDSG